MAAPDIVAGWADAAALDFQGLLPGSRRAGAGGDEPRDGGATRPMPTAARMASARAIGRIHGNQHLGRVIARMAAVQREGAPAVQRDDQAPDPGIGPPIGPISPSEALKTRAIEALKNVYGSIKKEITGEVEIVDDATLRSRFDDMQIRRKSTNPRTQVVWQKGDSLTVFPQLFGFADKENGIVNVLDKPTGGGGGGAGGEQLSTTIHELLHVNAAGDWAGTMMATFDEGQTEIMTMKVCASQGIPITPAYGGQRGRTEQLAEVVGQGLLEQGYFGGTATIVAAFDTLRGEGKWAELKRAIADGDGEKFNKIIKAPHTSTWAREKAMILNAILDEWWISDEDVARFELICRTANAADLKAIRYEVAPNLSSASDLGQRSRMRIALGM